MREKCTVYSIRKKVEGYTEVYIVFIFVYLHVILPYLVSTLLDYSTVYTSPASLGMIVILSLSGAGRRYGCVSRCNDG